MSWLAGLVKTGATLLHAAASVGSTALLKLFLEKGLDPNAADQVYIVDL